MKAGEKEFLRFMEGNDKNFIIPVYQRNYDWGVQQCKQLLKDLIDINKKGLKSYFLGSIVSIDLERDKILIIDGQQRLTTLSLLLLAIYNLLNSGEKKAKINKDQIKDEYLINKYSDDKTKKIKLKPIKNDAKHFCSLFDDDTITSDGSRIFANYSFFKRELKNLDLDEIFQSIKELVIVDIELKKGEDDPQLIFESLNSTGLALSESDKIRNFILMNEQEQKQEIYYERYWRVIEEKCLFKTSEFIRDFLSYKTRKIPNQKKVYSSFKDFYLKEDIKNNKEEFLKELLRFSGYYNFILKPEEYENKKIVVLLKELETLEVKVFNPALLELFEDVHQRIIDKDDLRGILQIIIAYVFRRAICEIPPNALNKVFLTLIHDVKEVENFSHDNYVDILKYQLSHISHKSTSYRFPTDAELKERLLYRDVFNMKTRLYLFEKLENYENKERVDIEQGIANQKIQFDHIIPQTITERWKKDLGENWQEIYEKYVHTLGNLTLTGYNQEMSNYPFRQKQTIGFNESRFWLNQSLKNFDSFGEKEIRERLDTLTERATKIWPYPQSNYQPVESMREQNIYSLQDEEDFSGSKIISFNILRQGEKKAESWADYYIKTMTFLLNEDVGYLYKFQDIDIEIGKERRGRANYYREIISGIFLYIHNPANKLLKNLRNAVEETDFELADFEFTIRNDIEE